MPSFPQNTRRKRELDMRAKQQSAGGTSEKRIADVEEELRAAEAEAQRMEAEEQLLIERLRKAQEDQKLAYDDLERVLTTPRRGKGKGKGKGKR